MRRRDRRDRRFIAERARERDSGRASRKMTPANAHLREADTVIANGLKRLEGYEASGKAAVAEVV